MKIIKITLALGVLLGVFYFLAPGEFQSWFLSSREAFDRVEARVESQKIQKQIEESPEPPGVETMTSRVPTANAQALAELAAMGEKISALSVLDAKALERYLEPAERILKYDPEAYEQYLWNEIESEGSRSLIFFMMGIYLEGNDSPGPLVHRVLAKSGDSDEQALVKIFTLEGLFHRVDTGRGFSMDPLPEVRPDLEKMVNSSKNLTLVKESLLALKSHYGYSRDELMAMIAKHPNRDVLAEML